MGPLMVELFLYLQVLKIRQIYTVFLLRFGDQKLSYLCISKEQYEVPGPPCPIF